MENLTAAQLWTGILALATALVTFSKAWDVVSRRLRPQREIRERLEGIERMLGSDRSRLDEQDKANAVIFRALYAQINHELSGNGDQILRDSRDEIQKYLTSR